MRRGNRRQWLTARRPRPIIESLHQGLLGGMALLKAQN